MNFLLTTYKSGKGIEDMSNFQHMLEDILWILDRFIGIFL